MMQEDQHPGSTRQPPAPSSGVAERRPAVDLELLTELVYQRWLEELRHERERGGWPD